MTKKEQAREILRVAALLAYVSDDVSPVEREVLGKLARRCGIDSVRSKLLSPRPRTPFPARLSCRSTTGTRDASR